MITDRGIDEVLFTIDNWYLMNKAHYDSISSAMFDVDKARLKRLMFDTLIRKREQDIKVEKSKFEIGQKVFFITDRSLWYKPINKMIRSTEREYWYSFDGTEVYWQEKELFGTEKELKDYFYNRIDELIKEDKKYD